MSDHRRSYRWLVCGYGSIGRRHAANLRELGQTVRIAEPNPERRDAAVKDGFSAEPGLDALPGKRPEAILIANPSSAHLQTALEAAEYGAHLFIEKPLATALSGLDELAVTVASRGLITMVGCNMRFHPGPRLVHEAYSRGQIGRVHCARFEAGSFMPAWHPEQDYRLRYSSRIDLGGGCVLDGIHEIDLACWFFGFPDEVEARLLDGSPLGIETETAAEIIFRYASGPLCSVHLDYLQRWRQRRCELIGTEGTLCWESRRQCVEMALPEQSSPQRLGYAGDYDINTMYLDEMRFFLDCLDHGRDTPCNVAFSAKVTQLALEAKARAIRKSAEPAGRKTCAE